MEAKRPHTVDAALAFITDYAEKIRTTVSLPPFAAINHVLADNLVAPTSVPRFDSAAMDGFAVRAPDLRVEGTTALTIAQTIAAGQHSNQKLGIGEAARIMTGAPVPPETDMVIVQECAEIIGNQVHLQSAGQGKPHIRKAGEDVQEGAELLSAGTRLTTGHATLLTAMGIDAVDVLSKPRIALLSTGDELVESGSPLGPGKIYDTNRPMLLRMLADTGAEVTDLGIIADDPQAIVSGLVGAAADHDIIISSGGASAGFADHLTQAVSQRGCLEFWKLDMRPGKPIGFGDVDHCPILLLPGNPVAAAVGFALFGRALIGGLQGQSVGSQQRLRLPIAASHAKRQGQTQALMARFRRDRHDRITCVEPLPDQGSASFKALAAAQALIILQPDQVLVEEGNIVEVEPLWPCFSGG